MAFTVVGQNPGQLDKLDCCEEQDTWGTLATGTFIDIAYDDFSILPENDAKVEEKATGSRYSLYVVHTKQDVRGTLVMQVWPDNVVLAHQLCGLTRTTALAPYTGTNIPPDYPCSFSFHWYNAADGDTYQITGARPDVARLSCSQGDPIFKMSIDFIAKTFTRANDNSDGIGAQTLPAGNSFQLADMGLWWAPTTITNADAVAAEEETAIEDLTIEIRQNLHAGGKRDASKNITILGAGVVDAEVSGSFVMHGDQKDRQWDYLNYIVSRNEGIALGVKFNYPSTGSPVDIFTYTIRNLILRKVDPPSSIRETKVARFNGVVEATGVSVAPVVFTSGTWTS